MNDLKQQTVEKDTGELWYEQQQKGLEMREKDNYPGRDAVTEASLESFPASDPPGWTKSSEGEDESQAAEQS